MASQFVTVQWIRPQRYEGVIEKIARSRIRGKVENGGEVRAMWRGKPYKVTIVDVDGYLSQVDNIPRKSIPKPRKVPKAANTSNKPLAKAKKRDVSPAIVPVILQTSPKVPMPSNNTRHRASRRGSLPETSPVRGSTVKSTGVKRSSTVMKSPANTTRPSSRPTTLTVTAVIEPDSSSSSAPNARKHTSSRSSNITPSSSTTHGPFMPPLNLLQPSVATYLKKLEDRVTRIEALYKALKPAE